MRILLTNDDGIGAEGLRRVAEMAIQLGEVWIVAPAGQCSAMSQRITLREELVLKEVDYPVPVHKAFSLTGTPADCVKVALAHVMPDHRPDYVFSGMNRGYNAGFDIAYSGTVGAAMEGIMNGIPSIAFSNEATENYEVADHYMKQLTEEILSEPVDTTRVWNINFPGCPLSECKGVLRDRSIMKVQYYADHYDEVEGENGRFLALNGVKIDKDKITVGSDISALINGFVSVGRVKALVL